MALRKFAFNVATFSAARVIQLATGFLAIPILARLLGPTDFGIVALAMVFVFFTTALSDAGLGASLVRTPFSDRLVWNSAFWVISGFGALLSLVLLALAWPVALIFAQPALTPMIAALAVLPLVQSGCAVFEADLRQREKFQHLAGANTFSALAGLAAAIAGALNGWAAWALIAQQLVAVGLRTLFVVASSHYRPRFEFSFAELGPHVSFGRDTIYLTLTGVFVRQIDSLFIGKMIGAAPLGLYSMAQRILALPTQLVSAPVQGVLFTQMVVIRNDLKALKDLVLIGSMLIALIVFPAIAVVAVAAEPYFVFFLSEKWAPAAPIFAAIAPAIALQTMLTLAGTMLMAIGRPGLRLRTVFEFALCWALVLPFTAQLGIEAVAISYTITYLLYLPRHLSLLMSPINCSSLEFVGNLMPAVLAALAAAAAQYALQIILTPTPLQAVGISALVVGCAYALLALLCRRRLSAAITLLRGILRQRGGDSAGAPDAPM